MTALEWDPPEPADEPVEEAAQRFSVHDLASAEWAMQVIARKRAALAEAEAYYEQTRRWYEAEREREAADERWLVEQLESWHRHLLDEDDRRKTVRLPSGELKARKLPDTVHIAEPDEFCAAYADTELVRTRMTPDLNAVKREVLKRGMTFEGVEVVPGDLKFTVAPAGPKADDGDPF